MNKRLFIVFILGFSSGLPMALLGSTLQAWYASSGMSVMATATLSLIGLPYVYRTLWAPILDRYTLFSFGRRRSWVLTMQVSLLLGFNVMAWFSPLQHAGFMTFLALLLTCFSATQDIAIDAHRAEFLPEKQHAMGASLAVFGYRLAMLVSGGLALIMAARMGWAFTYRAMGLCMILGMLAVLFSEEPKVVIKERTSFAFSFILPITELLSRPKILYLLAFIFCYKLGEAFTSTSSSVVMPFLIDGLHFSLETIGYINKMLGIASILLGGLTAGFLLTRFSLYCSLFYFGLLQALTNALFVVLAIVGNNVPLLACAVFADNFAAGLGSTALVALFMRLANKQFTGTQFSMLVALSTLPRILSGPIAGFIQMYLGWVGLYQLSIVFALLFIPFLVVLKEHTFDRRDDQPARVCA